MKSETKLFVGIIVGTLAIVGIGIALLSKPTPVVKVDQSLLIRTDSNKIATSSATVTLVEFSDFQCPACGAYYPIVQQVIKDFTGKMNFVYRNFPLTDLHPNAQIAAQAAEAAGLQGKYWEMHDALFTKQNDWSASTTPVDIFAQYATTFGLNVDQFKKDIDSDTVKNKIANDVADGNTLGINATPTFYLDSVKLDNPATLADFETAIKTEIAAKK
jgi:protein-disulfide isomerase